MYNLQELKDKYDADNDTMPGLPDVTWADYELICIVERLERRIAKLEAALKAHRQSDKSAPDYMSQPLNEGDGSYRP